MITGEKMGRKKTGTLALVALVGGLFLLIFAAGCGDETKSESSATTVDTGGRLQLTETYFDAGNVPVDTKAEHSFTIKNTGTGPLNLGQMSVKRLEGC